VVSEQGGRVFRVLLPLPYKRQSSNATVATKQGRIAQAEATRVYRHHAAYAYREAEIPPLKTPVTVELDYYLDRKPFTEGLYFPRDESNAIAAFKAGQDALADAGVVPGDGRKFVTQGPCRLHATKKSHGDTTGVVVTLREAP
jgi:hypothetical protein